MKQLALIRKQPMAYGGELLRTRAGRAQGRPLSTRDTMHLVLRSSRATGTLSMKRHAGQIEKILRKFSAKYGVKVLSLANVGNHLHLQIKLSVRQGYKPFIRAITAAIAMAVTGTSRWNKAKEKFWDYRPFTRVMQGRRGFLTLRDYIRLNRLEGFYGRANATFIMGRLKNGFG